MEGPPLGPGGEDITWPDQVAPRGRKVSSTRKIKPQTSNLFRFGITEAPAAETGGPVSLGITKAPSAGPRGPSLPWDHRGPRR